MTTDFDYSVRVKTGAGWRQFGRVRLMISVGQDYHEGKKLAAVVSWINRNPHVQHVHVSINDLLQRHNYMAAGMSDTEAKATALAEGALWMTRNDDILAGIKAPKLFTRWEDWLGRPGFEDVLKDLLHYAGTDILFDECITRDAESFAERRARRGEPVPAALVGHSRRYIEEELAVFALQSAALPAAEVYPGSNLGACRYLYDMEPLRKQMLPEKLRPLAFRYFARIDFDRINVTLHSRADAIRKLQR